MYFSQTLPSRGSKFRESFRSTRTQQCVGEGAACQICKAEKFDCRREEDRSKIAVGCAGGAPPRKALNYKHRDSNHLSSSAHTCESQTHDVDGGEKEEGQIKSGVILVEQDCYGRRCVKSKRIHLRKARREAGREACNTWKEWNAERNEDFIE